MYNNIFISAVIAAAGAGTRLNPETPKQFLQLAEKPVLAHTLGKFQNSDIIDEIILVVNKKYVEYCEKEIVNYYGFFKVSAIITGGESRQRSVYNGLLSVSDKCGIVLVHDGARPFVSDEIIESVCAGVYTHKCCVPGVPPKDTVKICSDKNYVLSTPDRSSLTLVQTPQGFNKEILLYANLKANEDGYEGTDDSSLVERLGYIVRLVQGSYDNFKITTELDMQYAKIIVG